MFIEEDLNPQFPLTCGGLKSKCTKSKLKVDEIMSTQKIVSGPQELVEKAIVQKS